MPRRDPSSGEGLRRRIVAVAVVLLRDMVNLVGGGLCVVKL